MTRAKLITVLVVLTVLAMSSYFGGRLLHTWRRLPEAYAAWDTGTLLVVYMKSNSRWPGAWQDLFDLSTSPPQEFTLRGSSKPEWQTYVRTLPNVVSVNWDYDPRNPSGATPVSRASGGDFPVLWDGGDPNAMVRDYLSIHADVLPAAPANK